MGGGKVQQCRRPGGRLRRHLRDDLRRMLPVVATQVRLEAVIFSSLLRKEKERATKCCNIDVV